MGPADALHMLMLLRNCTIGPARSYHVHQQLVKLVDSI